MSGRRDWRYLPTDPARERDLAVRLGIPVPAARVLVARGLADPAVARFFLEPSFHHAPSPFAVPGMETAARALAASRAPVLAVDGTPASALAAAALGMAITLAGGAWRIHAPGRPWPDGADLAVACGPGAATAADPNLARIVLDPASADTANTAGPAPDAASDAAPARLRVRLCAGPGSGYPLPGLTLAALAAKLGEALLFAGTPFFDHPIAVYDFETTGLDPRENAVIEAAALLLVNERIIDQFTTLVDPGAPIPPLITEITGLRDEDVAGAPREEEAFRALVPFLARADFLAGHNIVNFDNLFLADKAARAGLAVPKLPSLDTLPLARKHAPRLRNHKLATVLAHFDYAEEGYHRALADVKATTFALVHLLRREQAVRGRYADGALPLVAAAAVADGAPALGETRLALLACADRMVEKPVGGYAGMAEKLRPLFAAAADPDAVARLAASEQAPWKVLAGARPADAVDIVSADDATDAAGDGDGGITFETRLFWDDPGLPGVLETFYDWAPLGPGNPGPTFLLEGVDLARGVRQEDRLYLRAGDGELELLGVPADAAPVADLVLRWVSRSPAGRSTARCLAAAPAIAP